MPPKRSTELTPQQIQVLQLVWDGHSTVDIAERLKKTPRAVKAIRERIGLKLGTYNAIQAVRIGLAKNLLKVV